MATPPSPSDQSKRRPRLIPPFGLLIGFGLIVLIQRVTPWHPGWMNQSAVETVALVLTFLGVGLAFTGIGLFRRAGTGIKPFSEARQVVTGGPYRVTRNPMYLGMVLLLVAGWLKSGALLAAAVPIGFALWIDRAYIRREEVFLEEHLGKPYRDYKARVRRWL